MDEHPDQTHQIGLEAFGVRVLVAASSPDLLVVVESMLPPGWMPASTGAKDQRFGINADGGDLYSVTVNEFTFVDKAGLDVALGVLDQQLRSHIALNAPERIFVHAGVVADAGRAIVIPGRSFSGKTTLVAELVRAGADYYSDEYAVLDDRGLVHPYAKPLSIRDEQQVATNHHAHTLGGSTGDVPLPVGLIVATNYRPGTIWEPRPLSPGEAVLALLSNTVPAQDRPAEALAAIKLAVQGAVVLQGDRGDAAAIVHRLREAVRG